MKKRILFISFDGKQYSDNPKAISNYMNEHYPKVKQVWLFRDCKKYKNVLPKNINCRKLTKFNLVHFLSTSRIVVDNDSMVYAGWLAKMPKTKNQLFIQTWHGDKGFKKCYYEIDGYTPPAPFSTEIDGCIDYYVTGSTEAEPIARKIFKYAGEFLKVGCPRNDIMFKDTTDQYNKVREVLGLDKDTKILLYAPTFRQTIPENAERIDFDKIINILEKRTNEKWVVVFRSHHFHADVYNPNYIDGRTQFEDMVDILVGADMLITDYSSCAGDFALLKRPILLYVDDLQDYLNNDRGLHFDLKDSPFMYAQNNEELIGLVEKLDNSLAIENCKQILEFYGCYEKGIACEEISKVIMSNLYPEGK